MSVACSRARLLGYVAEVYLAACAAMFVSAYLTSIVAITVGYHRGLAHGALVLHPALRRVVIEAGIWLTGLDPKAWIVMHRMHHAFSDTGRDPHAPTKGGLLGMIVRQYYGTSNTIRGLRYDDPAYTRFASDLDFDLHPVTKRWMWWLPYVVHAIAGVMLGATVGWVFGAAYFLGIASHPLQGALVNFLGPSSLIGGPQLRHRRRLTQQPAGRMDHPGRRLSEQSPPLSAFGIVRLPSHRDRPRLRHLSRARCRRLGDHRPRPAHPEALTT